MNTMQPRNSLIRTMMLMMVIKEAKVTKANKTVSQADRATTVLAMSKAWQLCRSY